MKTIASLHYITHPTAAMTLKEQLQAVIQGGIRWIQFRQKQADDETFTREASETLDYCRKHRVTCVLNDRVDIAKTLGADGVHLGKEDLSPWQARQLLGTDKLIGCTANSFEDIIALKDAPIDYIGLGPFRFTTTKEKLSPVLGLNGFHSMLEHLKGADCSIPIIAIGGIAEADLNALFKTGIHGVALSQSIWTSKDPATQTRFLIETIQSLTSPHHDTTSENRG